MLSNLGKGLLEDGSPCELKPTDRQESIKLWTLRETQVLHAIVNCALSFKVKKSKFSSLKFLRMALKFYLRKFNSQNFKILRSKSLVLSSKNLRVKCK